MPTSPLTGSSDVVNVSLKVDGTVVPKIHQIMCAEVTHAFNRIPRATITILDGDIPNKAYPASDAALFKPGVAIVLMAGYGTTATQIFSGIVVRHKVALTRKGCSTLTLECRDKAVAMTVGRSGATHQDSTDSAAITSLITKHGLTADVTSTTATHSGLVQYDSTDWDFMVARAESNGLLVNVEAAKVTVKAPVTSGSPVLDLTIGVDIMDFDAELDSSTQLKSVETTAWDPSKQAIAKKTAAPSALTGNGNIAAADLAKILALEKFKLQSCASVDDSLLESWAKAQQLKAELSRIVGHVVFQGSALAKVGSILSLAGIGARFNGNILATSVVHRIADGNWTTEVGFGMASNWFVEQYDTTPLKASGTTVGINGLQIGVVKKIDGDPLSHYRVQVSIPTMQSEKEGIWARLATPRASSGTGTFFIPEVNDEVVLGFLNDDPSHPIVIGSLYSSKNKAPKEIEAENKIKAIVTKSKISIEFDDDKKILTLTTPGKNTVTLSDDAKSIELKDQTGNKVTLGESGIALDSPKDIKIKATGGVSIEATGKIELKATQDLSAEGMNLNLKAQVGLAAKGTATAEFSASGQTTLKGAMVMIN